MSNHTPGPWIVQSFGRGVMQIESIRPSRLIACMEEKRQLKANARLIAAAPDLLEALRDMVSDRDNLSAKTLAFAQAAINKATQGHINKAGEE